MLNILNIYNTLNTDSPGSVGNDRLSVFFSIKIRSSSIVAKQRVKVDNSIL